MLAFHIPGKGRFSEDIRSAVGGMTGIVMLTLTILLSSSLSAEAQFDDAQKQEIQQIIHEYLVTQPEVLKESILALQKKEQEKIQKNAQGIIFKNAKEIFDGGSPILGNPNGTVNVVEFLDYNCGHCRNSFPRNFQF